MKLKLSIIYLLLLLSTLPLVQANVIILDTNMQLFGGDEWEAEVSAERGDLEVFISSSQDGLNFTIYQNNKTVVTMSVSSSEPVNITIQVTTGQLILFARTSSSFFIISDIQIKLSQADKQVNGYITGIGVILFLALPFVYIFGRNQGLKQL